MIALPDHTLSSIRDTSRHPVGTHGTRVRRVTSGTHITTRRTHITSVTRAIAIVTTLAPALLAGLLTACRPAASDPAATGALRDTLMQRIADAYDFTRPDIVERMASLYPDTGRVISASGGHITTTTDSLRRGLADFWANVGVNMRNPQWQWGYVHVDRLAPDAAVLTGAWSIPHIAPTGNPHTIRGAWTAVFRRIDGEWLIVQEHLSVPPPSSE